TMDIAFQKGFDQFTGYLYQGISNFYLKKYDDAVAKFQESIKLNNSFPFTYLWLGKSYVGLQKNTEAIAAYTKCLELDPNNEEAQRDLKSLQK
ncbi:MAG TPA: tetratricopeptide repeat protein, partial [Ignavibacteria bacterium]